MSGLPGTVLSKNLLVRWAGNENWIDPYTPAFVVTFRPTGSSFPHSLLIAPASKKRRGGGVARSNVSHFWPVEVWPIRRHSAGQAHPALRSDLGENRESSDDPRPGERPVRKRRLNVLWARSFGEIRSTPAALRFHELNDAKGGIQ